MKRLIEKLEKQIPEFIRDLEKRFGPRDAKFELGRINPPSNGPYISDPSTSRIIDIYLTEDALRCPDEKRARWQLAHECVHLIDPHKNPTNFLEEGLATWYQNYKFGREFAECTGHYADAEKLVCRFMDILPAAIRKIRKDRRLAIGDIPRDVLVQYCPQIEEEVAQKLVADFPKRTP